MGDRKPSYCAFIFEARCKPTKLDFRRIFLCAARFLCLVPLLLPLIEWSDLYLVSTRRKFEHCTYV